MTIVAGYAPDERGREAIHLAAMLARSAGDDLVITSVVPAPWAPGMARIDAEYRDELDRHADRALERARNAVPDDLPARYVRHSARSAPAGLLEQAEQHGADLLVLGSSSAGVFGHVVLGSVTDRLVHSSPITLAMAPRGFRVGSDARVTRVTAAYGGSSSAEQLVIAAAYIGAQVGATMRIASFAVWSRPDYTTTLGTDPEELVFEEWTNQVQVATRSALAQVKDLEVAPSDVDVVVGGGQDWADAVEDIGWDDGDVLVVGSSELGPVARVFLGSRATLILRHSPVPVVVVPRGRAGELAERAAKG